MLAIRNILAATDLSDTSDRVVRTAAELALHSGARLHVVHAVALPAAVPMPAMTAGAAIDLTLYEDRRAGASQMLQAQLERSVPAAQRVSPALVEGESVPGAICGKAKEVAADLIVVGPHGDGKETAGLLGTTADNVLRSATVPVLVIRDTVPVPARRVLVAADPAESAAGIVDAALGWPAAFAPSKEGGHPAAVDVVYVLMELVTGRMPFDRARVLRGREPAAGAVRDGGTGTEPAELVLWGGNVADTILDYARETQPDLLVAASHGRGAVKRALLGSTSSAFARQAPCSVLLLPPALWTEGGTTGAGGLAAA